MFKNERAVIFVLLSYLIGWDRADTFPKIEWSEKQIFFLSALSIIDAILNSPLVKNK